MNKDALFADSEARQGLKYLLYEGGLTSTMVALCTGLFVTGFALLLGASDMWIGVLSALPMLADAAQPLGAYLLGRTGQHRRTFSLVCFTLSRALWVILLLLPYFGYHRGESTTVLYLLLLVTTTSAIFSAFGMVSLTWLMSDLVPTDRRGRYFGTRNAIATTASSIVALVGGQFIDYWKRTYGADDPHAFLIVYAFGLVAGLASLAMVAAVPEHRPQVEDEVPHRVAFGAMMRDRNYLRLVTYRCVLSITVALASPFFNVFMLNNLHMSYALISAYGVASSICTIIAMRPWGILSDHFGNRPIILATTFGAAAVPLIWLAVGGNNLWLILVVWVICGLSWAGITLGTFNMLLKITPDEHKSVYIGFFNATMGISWAIGSSLGGVIAEALTHWQWTVGHTTFVNFHVLMLLSGLGRLATVFLIRRVREPEAARVQRMVQVLWRTRAVNPFRAAHYYWWLLVSRGDR